jgi:HEAT repeat protein
MPLFGPPNVEKLRQKGNAKGLIRALQYVSADQWAEKSVRLSAIRALRALADARAVEPLCALMADRVAGSLGLRDAVGLSLAQIGIPAIGPLLSRSAHPDSAVCSNAELALNRVVEHLKPTSQAGAAIQSLTEALGNPNPSSARRRRGSSVSFSIRMGSIPCSAYCLMGATLCERQVPGRWA